MKRLALLALVACGGGEDGVDLSRPPNVDVAAEAPRLLSAMNLFAWDGEFRWNQRVVPYDLNTPLFSDHALKARAIYVPEGAAAAYRADGPFDFPVGTVLIKTFYFPADLRAPGEDVRLIETRILMRRANGWDAFPYVWNEAQTDAVLTPGGGVRAISFTDPAGEPRSASYLIPQRNQCQACHLRIEGDSTTMVPIGPTAANLHRDGQLANLAALGLLEGLPDPAGIEAAYDFRPVEAGGVAAIAPADLDRAARTYLDVNCGHCHSPNAVNGVTSQLWLDRATTDPFHLGVCKRPGSAGTGTGGFTFDIVPGDPDHSILYFRVATEEQGAMMPLLGRSITHARGAELLRAWIAAMPPQTCQ